jgi:hypothetical protein
VNVNVKTVRVKKSNMMTSLIPGNLKTFPGIEECGKDLLQLSFKQ